MKYPGNKALSLPALIYIVLIGGVITSISIMAWVPPVSRDAMIHHLAVPKLYIQHGGIFEIPSLSFSYYPMNLDLLYLIPLYFKNDILPKFIHFAFALITTLMVFRYLKRRFKIEYALLGSLFFLSIPIIVCQSTIAYVDLGLVCFLFGAMIYLFKWIENDFSLKHLIVSAMFCGLALGTKYNGLIGLFLLGLFVPLTYARFHSEEIYHAGKAIVYSFIYVIVALTVFSPWMIRNTIWTGNPVYPLYNSFFNPKTASIEMLNKDEAETHHHMTQFEVRRDLYGETGWEIALIPLRVFFQGKDNDPKYFDGKANPFLLLLPVFAFFGIRSDSPQIRTEKFLMIGFSVLFLLFACAKTVIRIRYFAPIFPPLVILSMFGLQNIQKKILGQSLQITPFMRRLVLFFIIFVMLGLNAKYITERFNYVQPFGYLTGKVNRDAYIQKFCPEYASMKYANRHLTQKDHILGVYTGNRGYYLDIEITYSLNLLQKMATTVEDPKKIAEGLQKQGIDYLLVNFKLFNFWVKTYNLHQKMMLKGFFEKWTVTEFSKDHYGLLKIIP